MFRFESAVFYANCDIFRKALYKQCGVNFEALHQQRYLQRIVDQKVQRLMERKEVRKSTPFAPLPRCRASSSLLFRKYVMCKHVNII